MELKSKSVKLFCAVVEMGSLHAAAEKMAMSPPAASRAIAQLEARIGFALFARQSKTLTLTDDGRAFYRVAAESVRAWRILEDFPGRRSLRKRELRIAVFARHCSDVIIPAVAEIMKRNEKTLNVIMDVHQSRDIWYSKYSHPFDVGFGTLLSTHDDLKKVPIANLGFRLVVPKSNPLALKKSVTRSDYEHENFIMLSRDSLEQEFIGELFPELRPEQVVGEFSTTQVALRFVRRGIGVHITDELACRSVAADCAAVPLKSALKMPFYVFWPVGATELRPEILQCVGEIAKSIRRAGIPLTEQGEAFLERSGAQGAA
ncbi:MAG: HTH lysR-type domain-containing protein [Burkholderia sp.]|jgi:DNA-binding transcriptional LysR family regulator